MTLPIHIDPNDPFEALSQAGASWQRSTVSKETTINLNGIPLSLGATHGALYKWRLPQPALVAATFSKESLTDKLKKIFVHEIQVGEPEFDDAVYIATREREATRGFLQDEATRNTILDVIIAGGSISIDGAELLYQFQGEEGPKDQLAMAHFVAAVISLG